MFKFLGVFVSVGCQGIRRFLVDTNAIQQVYKFISQPSCPLKPGLSGNCFYTNNGEEKRGKWEV